MSGLRERKKLRTRSTLVDVATELCVRQGYDNTTVDQIAAAADVSPRTFSRYFATKDAVIAAIIEDVTEFVAKELAAQPSDISEYEALFRAHLAAIRADGAAAERAADASAGAPAGAAPTNGIPTTAFNRLAVLFQIVNSSAQLPVSNFSARQAAGRLPGVEEIARRMQLPVEDDAVHLVIDTWQVIMNTACRGLGLPGHAPLEPDVMCDRITETYALFLRTQAPWAPPPSAQG
jgi:AcrR family transcriptional regulator